jgi:Tetracyclin repressor-like, C-terminal domain
VLEFAYWIVREDHIDPPVDLPALQALARFAGYAFDNFSKYPDFIRLNLQENLQGARFLEASPTLIEMNRATLTVVKDHRETRPGRGDDPSKRRSDECLHQLHWSVSLPHLFASQLQGAVRLRHQYP